MMAPESFAQTQTRQATDVVRVALERRGVIGFIEVRDGMTLAEARAHIWEDVEDAPQEFQFVLDDGAPVSARQETTQKIASFYPTVKIRESRRSRMASTSPSSRPPLVRSHSAVRDIGGESAAASTAAPSTTTTSEKVCVVTAAGNEFHTWIVEDYTFQQLRRDAARYWHVPASQVALTDADGCLWPEQAKILSVMDISELHERKIMLEYKAGALARGSDAALGRRRGDQPLPVSLSSSSSLGGGSIARTASTRRLRSPSAALAPRLDTCSRSVDSPVEELWRIFTFYCVNGDSMELECIKAHQFNKLLRDARVFSGSLTPAMVDIIYMSETKGKPQSSAKMSYNEFLNALVKVAIALQHTRGLGGSSKLLRGVDDEDALFQRLVADHILPLAARWPTRAWDEQTERLRKPEVVAFVSKFLEPLLEMFMFYARSHTVHPVSGVKEFYMSYADYQRFVNDFSFANLQLSSVEAAQVFVASCSSPPFHGPLLAASIGDGGALRAEVEASDAGGSSSQSTSSSEEASWSSNGGSAPANSVAASVQRILGSAEGLVAYAFAENQVGKMCMGVSAFLDALGRTGLTAFSKTRPLKTIHCVKGVFHHLSRGLTRSRVLEILRHHGPTSMRASAFYSGTVAFNNKFLDMWRYEGSPDYLTGDLLGVPPASSKLGGSPAAGSGVGAGAGASDKPLVAASQTLGVATSQTLGVATSAALKRRVNAAGDERSALAAGAGRGREALDRLVRNSFLRSAAVEAATVKAAGATKAAVPSHAELEAAPVEPAPGGSDSERSAGLASERSKPLLPSAAAQFDADACEVRSPTLVLADVAPTGKTLELPLSASSGASSGAGGGAGGGSAVVLAPPAPLARDDKSFYERVLLKGGVFKKYGQWGNPHRRFVWFAKDADAIYWRPVNKRNALAREGIPVAAVVSVLPGSSPRTRYAFMKHLSDERSICRCFSVVAEDRRLDLEADSEATRETWMDALLFLTEERRAAAARRPA